MEGFVVGRAGVGSIAWDGAIDLRDVGAIDLVASGVVRLARATAAVYDAPEAARRKPPRGVGLNRPAVITLVGIARPPSRVDPTGSRDSDAPPRSASASEPPSSSAPSFASTLAAASPEFLGWDDATRTWTFRVFHFSRYGLDLSASESESEEDEMDDDAPGRRPEAAAARRDEEAAAAADDDVMEVAGEGIAPGVGGVAPPPPRRVSPARKPPLGAASAAALFSPARDLNRPRGGGAGGARGAYYAATPAADAANHLASSSPYHPSSTLSADAAASARFVAGGRSPLAASTGRPSPAPRPLAAHRPLPPPARKPPACAAAYAIAASVVGAADAPAKAFPPLTLPARPLAARPRSATDAHAFLGASFRPSWGPGGRLAHAGGASAADAARRGGYEAAREAAMNDGSPHAPTLAVTTERFVGGDAGEAVATNGGLRGNENLYRRRRAVLDVGAARATMEVALRRTAGLASGAGSRAGGSRATAGSGGGAPATPRRDDERDVFARGGDDDERMDFEGAAASGRFGGNYTSSAAAEKGGFGNDGFSSPDSPLFCPRLRFVCDRAGLPDACRAYLDALERHALGPPGAPPAPLPPAKARELFATVSAWDLVSLLFGDAPEASRAPRGSAADRHRRRAALDRWLRRSCARSLNPADTPPEFLRGRHAANARIAVGACASATATAAKRGDPRLATVLAQAGAGGLGRDLASDQLELWRSGPVERFVGDETMTAFGLLAGEVAPPLHPEMCADRWTRAFAAHARFAHPPSAPLRRVVEGYLACVEAGSAPFPAAPGSRAVDPRVGRLKDAAFNLVALAAAGGVAPGTVPALSAAFHPLTYCESDLGNAHVAWHLFQALRACGALEGADVAPLADALAVAACEQLLRAREDPPKESAEGGKAASNGASPDAAMTEWAVFVAMHVEDDARRSALARHVVHARCADWCDCPEKRAFLEETLGVPREWLRDAEKDFRATTRQVRSARR